MDTGEHASSDDREVAGPVSDKCTNKCTESTPAMQVASVVAPSVLILTVVLLSLGIFYKMARYQKIRTSQLKKSVKHKASRDGLINKVRELKGCGLLVGSSVPEVFQTKTVISRSCSENDYRVLIASPHNVWRHHKGPGADFSIWMLNFTAYAWLIPFKNTPTIGSLGYFRNLNFFITYFIMNLSIGKKWPWCKADGRNGWEIWWVSGKLQISKDLHGVVKADFFTQWYVESWLQETVI